MHDRAQLELSAAAARLQQGDARGAEQACRGLLAYQPAHHAAMHLLGLARDQQGDREEAERWLQASVELQPGNVHYLMNMAQFLRRVGRASEAEARFRKALAAAPAEREARRGLVQVLADLGRLDEAEAECRRLADGSRRDGHAQALHGYLLNALGRAAEAEPAYRRALQANPGDAVAAHNLGAVLSRLERAEEALVMLDRAAALGPQGPEWQVNRGRTLALLYRLDEAEQAFAAAAAAKPDYIDAQTGLAKLRYMRGDAAYAREFAAAAAARPADLRLQASLSTLLRCAGELDPAEHCLRAAMARSGRMPGLGNLLAQVLRDRGDIATAAAEARADHALLPGDADVAETYVSTVLQLGQADEAWPVIEAWRARQPHVQTWLAYQATAARLLGRPEYERLYDYTRLVRTFEVQPPAGWADIGAFNAALLAALGARHAVATHPLDQSLRNGTQTMRSLVSEQEPAIKAALAAFNGLVEGFLRELGPDPGHPLQARNRGRSRIIGAWSVRLGREGRHVNHIHPEGWISSAYYVAVPGEVADPLLRSGWIQFGESRYPVPGMAPALAVQPRAGLLVLFPSYMWHGTTPIHGDEPRVTIAFDAVPA